MRKSIELRSLSFDHFQSYEGFKFEAALHVAGGRNELKLGGTLSNVLVAKITRLIEEEVGAEIGAEPTSTGLPDDDDEIPF